MNTKQKAKLFYEKEWGDERILIHSECVIDVCKKTIDETSLNEDIFVIAGYLHDMGQKINKEEHEKLSIPFLEKFMGEYPEFKDLELEIKDCILGHRSYGNPSTLSGLIFKVADKVALLQPKWISYKENLITL